MKVIIMNKNIEQFLNYLKYELNYSALTIKGYEQEITKFLQFLNAKQLKWQNVENDDIRNYLKKLDEQKYSKASISRNLSALRSFYKFLSDNNKVSKNPFKSISNPKKDKKLPNFLNYEEINKIFESISLDTELGIRNRFIVEILYDTGIRVSELVNITLSSIHLEEKTILITGKGNKKRIVYFGDYLLEMFHLYLNHSRNKLIKQKQHSYLVVNNRGDKITTRGVEMLIDKIVNEASLKHKISPHVLRHTFATHMLNGGSDIKTVQQLLGHESLSTTGIYTHITNDVLRTEYLKNHPRSKV